MGSNPIRATDRVAIGLVSAAGNVLSGVGADLPFPQTAGDFDWRRDYIFLIHPHNVGEALAFGSLAILLLVCLVMLGVGVLGALRPTTHPA